MVEINIQIPKMGESIQEAYIAQWYKTDGSFIKKDEPLLAIETDKISMDIKASAEGCLKIAHLEGETVPVGEIIARIEVSSENAGASEKDSTSRASSASISHDNSTVKSKDKDLATLQSNDKDSGIKPGGKDSPTPIELKPSAQFSPIESKPSVQFSPIESKPSAIESKPSAQSCAPSESKASMTIQTTAAGADKAILPVVETDEHAENITLKPMSPIRQKIASRLLEARRNTAMLTTFNEVDMTRIQALRSQYKEAFLKKYGVSLGLMAFFIKASIEALKLFPQLNAFIEGTNIVYHHYYHIGVAVGSERGLIVPVIKHADRLSFAEIEIAIKSFVKKIEDNLLELKDLEGGTFTVSNGGIFGSLCSTPILNMPQSGILGMHKIQDRPVASNGQIVIKPMMYLALSYDHRMVDGRESVYFLNHIKDCVENPERIMIGV